MGYVTYLRFSVDFRQIYQENRPATVTSMPEIEFTDNQVIIRIPKALLVLTKAQFIEALRQGKAYRRREQRAKRMALAAQEAG